MFNSIMIISVIGVLTFNFSIMKKDPEYFKKMFVNLIIALGILLSAQLIKTTLSELSLNRIKEKDPIRFSQTYQSSTNPAFTLVHYYEANDNNKILVDRLEIGYVIFSFLIMVSLGYFLLTSWKQALNEKLTKMPIKLNLFYIAVLIIFSTMIYFPLMYSIITFSKTFN